MCLHHTEHVVSTLQSMLAAQAPAITSLFPESRRELEAEKNTCLYLRKLAEVVSITTFTPCWSEVNCK